MECICRWRFWAWTYSLADTERAKTSSHSQSRKKKKLFALQTIKIEWLYMGRLASCFKTKFSFEIFVAFLLWRTDVFFGGSLPWPSRHIGASPRVISIGPGGCWVRPLRTATDRVGWCSWAMDRVVLGGWAMGRADWATDQFQKFGKPAFQRDTWCVPLRRTICT